VFTLLKELLDVEKKEDVVVVTPNDQDSKEDDEGERRMT